MTQYQIGDYVYIKKYNKLLGIYSKDSCIYDFHKRCPNKEFVGKVVYILSNNDFYVLKVIGIQLERNNLLYSVKEIKRKLTDDEKMAVML